MNRSQMQAKLQAVNNLPTLPVIAMEVNRLLMDAESPIDELLVLLERDPTLVMRILRLVNSSFYGFKSKVNNLRHAVTLLGYNTVRNAVVTVAVMDTLSLQKSIPGFNIDTFWTHAIETAVTSRYLAQQTGLVSADDAFIAGLLHDIGKVLLANFFPDTLVRLLDNIQNNGQTFHSAERSLNLWPHSHMGGFLAQRWALPEELVLTIKHHHAEASNPNITNMTTIIDVANRLAHMMSCHEGYHLDVDLDQPAVTTIMTKALDSDGKWYAEVKQATQEACNFFNKGQAHD
ncbi:MAG: HDOD domain-containing protein [Desulfatitalea sp.]|nr:HDOD domain-containing protein [Desulfatitalea sp.]NNJ99119.1 HDOD domain-containing protein [Desulfatitalea sp.]